MTWTRYSGALVASCVALNSVAADDNWLRGVTEMQFVVEEINQKGARCGLNKDEVAEEFKCQVLANSGVRESKGSEVILNLAVTAIGDGDVCAASISAVLLRHAELQDLDGRGHGAYQVMLWDNGAIVMGRSDSLPGHVREAVGLMGKKLALEWLKAQLPKR